MSTLIATNENRVYAKFFTHSFNLFMMKYISIVCLCTALYSCSNVNEFSSEPYFKTSFDDIAGWVPESSLLAGNSYSGNYAIKTDSSAEYSLVWKRTFLKLSTHTLTKVRISAYAKLLGAKNNACIVVSIDSGDKTLYWNSLEFKKHNLNSKSWKKVESFIEIPLVTDSSAQINIYLWGKEGSAVVIDDLEVEFCI
ncbi:MAG: hypothetical protein KBH11_05985 [Bacteroidia bacterium]|nr:hypothetical protein [Bacteroidota bacterium]MBK7388772.1 hypothetical protein [Bacteroidota bacterium]MBK7968412.1 hypothetical protein [Bacteroidota bacterium]MBP9082604.1 hypothetical protein [Bacteroidia bacterium]